MKARKRDYYEVLGVGRNAGDAELKRAFRELARKYHPDINPGPGAEERFKEANEAYAILSDPRMRQRYDRFGFAGVDKDLGAGFGSVVDMFDDLIGDILRRRKQKRSGRDLRYTLELSFEEAALGCTKTIRIPATERTGAAGAVKQEKSFTVAIPAGTKSGAVKMIKNEGEPGEGGGRSGDLHVIVRVLDHPVFRRDGYEIWCEVPVSFSQAALGTVIDVPTLQGKVRMRIPEGTQSGRVFRIHGRGIPRTATLAGARGDQLVRIVVETPTGLTARQRRLLEEFAEASGDSIAHPQRRGFLDKVKALF